MTVPPKSWLSACVVAAMLLWLPSAQAAGEGQAGRFYEDALARYDHKDFAGAVLQLKNALQIDKRMLQAHLLLGKAMLASGDVAGAEVAFNEALRLGVNRAEVVLPLAKAILAQGRLSEIVDPQRFPLGGLSSTTQSQLLLLKSAAAADLGDTRGALRAIEDARALNPGSIDVWLAEVPIRIRARQFKEAQAALDKAHALDPKSAEVLYQQGSLLHVRGNLEAAAGLYDRALAVDPGRIDARLARAGILIDLKRYDAATKDVDELKARRPDDARAWYLHALLAEHAGKKSEVRTSLAEVAALIDAVPIEYIRYRPQTLMLGGLAHYGLNEREKAIPYFENLQRVMPGSPASKLLASLYISAGYHDRAIDSLEQYLRVSPNDAQATALLASTLMTIGRHARAASLMQDAIRTSNAPELHTAYGLTLIGIGQPADAITELETAYKKDPGQTRAGYVLVGLYLRDRQVTKAVAIAQSLVAREPANPSFQDLLGQAKAIKGDLAGARAAFEQAIALDATLVTAQLNLARMEIGAKRFDRAQTLLDAVLKTDERNTEAMYEQARLAERRGSPQDALRWLVRAYDVGGVKDLRSALALVDLHMRQGRPADALKVAREVSAGRPDDLRALLALARVQLANADPVGARTTLGTATRIAGYDAPLQVEIALLQVAAGNLQGAAYSLDKALAAKADYLPAQVLLTGVETQQGEFAKAEQRAQQILRKVPKLAIGYSLLGDLAVARNQPVAAVEAYRKALDVQPSSESFSRLFRAQALVDAKAAFALADQWLKTHPKDALIRQLVAEGQVRAGNLPAARREYEQLRQLLPDDAGVANNLANVLLRLNDPGALAMAEKALALAPTDPVTIDTTGWIALRAGKIDRAIELLRDARLRNPESSETRYHLAAALAQSGRSAEARSELTAAMGKSSPFEGRAEAQALLQTLK
jgi:putative PEP-CTERM system TPR-repeat lipoprotein